MGPEWWHIKSHTAGWTNTLDKTSEFTFALLSLLGDGDYRKART